MIPSTPIPGTLKMGFLLTDGVTTRDNRAVRDREIKKIHSSNITMFALGVGDGTDVDELRKIAGSNATDDRVFEVNDYASLETISQHLFTTVCQTIETRWADFFAQKEFYLPVGFVVLIIIVVIVVCIVGWRLSIIARRKYLISQLDQAKNDLRRSQSEINRLYLEPKTTVNVEEIMKGTTAS